MASKSHIIISTFAFTCLFLFSCDFENTDAFDKGLEYYENGLYQEAIVKFSNAIELDIEKARSFYYKGMSYQKLNQNKKAIWSFNQSLKVNPEFHVNYIARGNIKSSLKKYNSALKDYNKVINLLSGSNEKSDLYNLSSAYNNRGLIKRNVHKDFNASIEDFNIAFELDPEFHLALYNRGLSKFALNDFEGSIEDYTKAIELSPMELLPFYERGRSKNRIKDTEGAIKDYSKAIEIDPNHSSSYNDRGLVKVSIEKYEEAIEDFSKAIELGDSAFPYNNRGFAKFKLKKYDTALIDCKKSLKLDPDNSWAYYNIGLINYKIGEIDIACEYFLKSKEMGMKDAEKEYFEKCKR